MEEDDTTEVRKGERERERCMHKCIVHLDEREGGGGSEGEV